MSTDNDTEEAGGEVRAREARIPAKKAAFSFLKRSDEPIDEKDWRSPLIGKFLTDHIDRLEDDLSELKPYRQRYYDTFSELRVLQDRRGLTKFTAGMSAVMLAVGGIGLSVAKDLWQNGSAGFIVGACSVLLIVSSFFVRVRSA